MSPTSLSKEDDVGPPPAAEKGVYYAPAAAAAASSGAAASPGPPPPSPSPLQQQQLAEFNQWLFRWNNYQQHLAHYWQGRYHSLYQANGGGKVAISDGKKGRRKSGDVVKTVGDKVELKWNMRFQELLEFKQEHGHCNVPKEFTYKFSPPLGHWVGRMRHLHKNGKLDPQRHEKLEDAGFEFVMSKVDGIKFSVVWDTCYQALKAFRDVNGHVEVPKGYKPQPDSAELDGWITRQRKHFKDGKMPDHLKSKLQALGLNLGGRGRPFGIEAEGEWSVKYKALAQYCADHGDADVPEKYNGDRELGYWVKAQRDAYSDGMLPDSRVTMLNQIGFNFYHGRASDKTISSDPWQRRLTELKAYKEKSGNTNVPKKFSLNLGLGNFVYNQRRAYKDKILPEDKVKALEDLGFDWTFKRVRDRQSGKGKTNWELRFDELQEHKSKFGNLIVPNGPLATWAKRQRKCQREGVMKSDKYERLKALGFDFGGPKQVKKPWMEQYEALVEFKNEHGHIDVPVHYEPNPPLYYWIGTQKQFYKKGKLQEDRLELLKSLDFDFSIKPRDRTTRKVTRAGNKPFLDEDEWEKCFSELEDYKEQNGDCNVPQRAGRLGSWVHYMRYYVKRGKISQDRVDRLNELGFTWNVTEDRWMQKFETLSKWKADHGHFNFPGSHALYSWVAYQRKSYLEASLSQDRVDLLSSIAFDFDTPPARKPGASTPETWESRFQDLVDFKEETGNCEVPQTYDPNPALAKWAASQRTKYRRGNLSDDKTDRLNDIGFDFSAQDKLQTLGVLKVPQVEPVDRESYLEGLWDSSYQELAAYKNHFGHCNIPVSYKANPSLGAWAFSQRMAYKKDKLSEERIDKLNELGFSFGPHKRVEEV